MWDSMECKTPPFWVITIVQLCMVRIVLWVYSLSVKSALIRSSPSAALPVDLNDPNVVLEEFSQINNMSEEKKIDNHTQERTPRIYVVRPLAYIHRRQQGESFTNKHGEYKSGVDQLSQTQTPINPSSSLYQRVLSQLWHNSRLSIVAIHAKKSI